MDEVPINIVESSSVPLEHNPDTSSGSRPRLNVNKIEERSDREGDQKKRKHAWLKNVMTESYVDFTGDMMYPKKDFKPYGNDPEHGNFPINRVSTLGFLKNPLRKRTAHEHWSPYEISMFESSIYLYGKDFNIIHKFVTTKSVKEVIEFYYDWKNTAHYRHWKKSYIPDERIVPVLVNEK